MRALGARSAARVAWGVGLACFVLLVADSILLALDWKAIDAPATTQFQYFLQAPIVGVLGVLIATRRPRNPIGWLLLAIAAVAVIFLLADFTAMRGLLSGASSRSWVAWPAWVFGSIGTPGAGALLVAFVILYFPTGRLPGPRWRWAAWTVFAAGALLTTSTLIGTTPIQLSPRLPGVPNPVAVPALSGLTYADSPIFVLTPMLLSSVLVAALVVRFRRARDAERRQLRWFAFVASAALGIVILGSVVGVRDLADKAGFFIAAVLVPATIGLAVMRYGLYDLDIFISRTIVYGSLAVFITAVYVGIAVGIGTLVGSGGKPNLGLSILATAIVAVGFQPVRERLQRIANRMVYGERATPYEVLSRFSERVAESYASDEVLPRMARVLAEGTGAVHASVWLRAGDMVHEAAAWPNAAAETASARVLGGALPELPGADRAVAVRHQGALLGALTVAKRRGESLTPIEEKLLADLASQAGLVLKNVGLTDELLQRLEDLRASRQRLVAAQDGERRRLERNLHDGAQQNLVALKVKLGLATMFVDRDINKTRTLLSELANDADEALETLRGLARGIYPPLLADRGLHAALESQARKATVPVEVVTEGLDRYPQEIESAVYFCCLEALQNVQKYAEADRVTLTLSGSQAAIAFEVADNGRGFDVALTKRGAGLTNMTDRVDALGGAVEVSSAPGQGTRISGSLPVTMAVEVA